MLNRLEDGLWDVETEVPRMSIGRHMTVVRLDDGELLVHNPIVLDDAGKLSEHDHR